MASGLPREGLGLLQQACTRGRGTCKPTAPTPTLVRGGPCPPPSVGPLTISCAGAPCAVPGPDTPSHPSVPFSSFPPFCFPGDSRGLQSPGVLGVQPMLVYCVLCVFVIFVLMPCTLYVVRCACVCACDFVCVRVHCQQFSLGRPCCPPCHRPLHRGHQGAPAVSPAADDCRSVDRVCWLVWTTVCVLLFVYRLVLTCVLYLCVC